MKHEKICRRNFLKNMTAGACLASLLKQVLAGKNGVKPNIIYINVDDLGWADLGYQGSAFYKTPNIDGLASQGMVFTNAYAPAANCAPSRACCLTGQYTPRHGVYTVNNSARGLSADRKLIPTENTLHIKKNNLTIASALRYMPDTGPAP